MTGEELSCSEKSVAQKGVVMSHRASALHLSPFMPEDLGRIVQAGPPILMPGGDVLYPATRFEDGVRRVRLTRLRPSGDPDNLYDGEMADPALSSDGRRVAFVGRVNGEAGVALLDVESRAVRLLPDSPGPPGHRSGRRTGAVSWWRCWRHWRRGRKTPMS